MRRAEQKGPAYLHRLLSRVDPSSARNISPNDKPKIIRALEVYFLTSVPISQHFTLGRDPLQGFEVLQIGLNPPRQQLYEFIDRRVKEMFATGLVAEVQAICSTFGPDLKPLQSLGYAQTVSYLRGEMSLAEAVALTQRQTRQYAKRQLTWFRRDKEITLVRRLRLRTFGSRSGQRPRLEIPGEISKSPLTKGQQSRRDRAGVVLLQFIQLTDDSSAASSGGLPWIAKPCASLPHPHQSLRKALLDC